MQVALEGTKEACCLRCFLQIESIFLNGWVYAQLPLFAPMDNEAGSDVIGRLGGKDLNRDGRVINLVVVGSSRFYDYSLVEEAIEEWASEEAHPDLVITGGASGVDYLAERWADNNNVPYAVFSEQWNAPRTGLEDEGRAEAATSLTNQLLEAATHVLAFPSQTSKWTNVVIENAKAMNIPVKVVQIE